MVLHMKRVTVFILASLLALGLAVPAGADNATMSYQLSWGSPEVFGWWSEDTPLDADQSARYSALINSADSPYGFDASGLPSLNQEGAAGGSGSWGAGIRISGTTSFMENLVHTLRLAYTRSAENPNQTDNTFAHLGNDALRLNNDWGLKLGIDHSYFIYENMAAFIELGYVRMKLEDSAWRGYGSGGDNPYDANDAWKARLSFQFSF